MVIDGLEEIDSRIDAELILFVKRIAALEHTFKELGYFNSPLDESRRPVAPRSKSFDANWDAFIADAGPILTRLIDHEESLRDALATLQSDPPRKLLWNTTGRWWSPRRCMGVGECFDHECFCALPNGAFLLHSLRRVRNNLFHGAKSVELDGRVAWADPHRTLCLLFASRAVPDAMPQVLNAMSKRNGVIVPEWLW